MAGINASVNVDPASITAIAFDLDNTLYSRDTAVHGWIRSILSPDEALIAEAIAFDNSGFVPRPDFYGWIADHVDWADTWQEVEQRVQQEIFEFVKVTPAINCALEVLANHYPLGLLTNGDGEFQRKKFAQLGIVPRFRPECCFATGELGVHKPERGAFEPLIEAFRLPAEEILFVGDNPVNDIQGAQELGMRTCWIQLREDHTCPVTPDWTVSCASELLGILDK